MARKQIITINDGFNPELAEGARFEGIFEFPTIEPVDKITLPKHLVPFSERKKIDKPSEAFVVFYEHDDRFKDLINDPDKYIKELKRFAGVISPDNSLYRDMPLACQICNIYRSRLIGSYLQRQGINVIGNCRWGDERTCSKKLFDEPISFTGLPKNNIISVGTYGCIKGNCNQNHFKKGLNAMIKYLRPHTVIVYGAIPDRVFSEFKNKTAFINYKDWTSIRHRRKALWGVE